jgi:RNA polymerase sigma factor (sigma-70 family)
MTTNNEDWLAERFEAHRGHLRAVAYRLLGSLSDADDAVQEAWLRLGRADTGSIDNLGGWLTTVVARVCLDLLRARRVRREEPVGGPLEERLEAGAVHLPEPIVGPDDQADPEQQALLAEGVGLALQVVLDTLAPAERLAFVLHDMFAVPFDQVAPIVGRSPAAARQLASRARRRVRGSAPMPDADRGRQRAVVDAFQAAARAGDFDALLALLDPEVVLRVDLGAVPAGGAAVTRVFRGAREVAEQALSFSGRARFARPALVNGAAGVVVAAGDRLLAVMGLTVRGGRIAEIDILADPERLGRLDLAAFGDRSSQDPA